MPFMISKKKLETANFMMKLKMTAFLKLIAKVPVNMNVRSSMPERNVFAPLGIFQHYPPKLLQSSVTCMEILVSIQK